MKTSDIKELERIKDEIVSLLEEKEALKDVLGTMRKASVLLREMWDKSNASKEHIVENKLQIIGFINKCLNNLDEELSGVCVAGLIGSLKGEDHKEVMMDKLSYLSNESKKLREAIKIIILA